MKLRDLNPFSSRTKVNIDNDTLESFLDIFGGIQSAAGLSVTPSKAQQFTAVSSCIKVISETLGQLSVDVYERTNEGKVVKPEHPLFYLLHDEPNELMTSATFHESLAFSMLVTGNAYARIYRDEKRDVRSLQLLDPYKVEPSLSLDGKSIYYKIEGRERKLNSFDIIHIKSLSQSGLLGISPLKRHADAIGLGLAEQQFASKFFANGATIAGVITKSGKFTPEQLTRLRETWRKTYSTVAKSHKTAILDEGADYKPIGVNPNDSQLIESRKFSIREIARIYRVPPHMIADLEDATFSNIEHQGLEFAKYTMMPYVKKFEQEYNRKLFKESEKGRLFTRFNIESLQRGDTETRMNMYVKGIQNGWYSPNEVRQMEGLNKRDGGDIYLTPMNLTTNPNKDE